jgi:predicted DNA-binding protein with PD1-like motif
MGLFLPVQTALIRLKNAVPLHLSRSRTKACVLQAENVHFSKHIHMKLLHFLLPAAAILIAAGTASVDPEPSASGKYTATTDGYLLVLKPGDDVLGAIKELAERERIPSGNFSGIGFVTATFGYFNPETKTYEPKEYKDVELASLNGSIAWQNDTASIHAHALATNRKFETFGGHLLAATVGNGTVEVYITVYKQRLQRKKDPAIGANVLQLE